MELLGEIKEFHAYMVVERGLSPRTGLEYCRDIVRFQNWLDGEPLNTVDVRPIRKWIVGLMADGSNKPQSVHRKIAALHAFFKWLVREEVRPDNPVDAIERPKCEKRLPVCASEAEVNKFLVTTVKRRKRILELRDKAMLELMYGSGLRRAEVCSVNVGDFDPDGDIMQVVGKGNKQRAVFLSGPSIDAIKLYLEARSDVSPADPMFTTFRGERMTVRQLWCVFRDYRKVVALTKHVTPHSFRHSFATHMIEHGADIVTLKELMGHASVATTQVYTNVSLEHMRGTFRSSHPRARAS